MNPTDIIAALESLGYTSRESAFLYLVAVHSGYFLRRQFDFFINRQLGAISQSFLEKARLGGHIEVLDYKPRHVYHLFFKSIYRLLGNPDSQNRLRKADASIRIRLMSLDYVLENQNERFLETDSEKIDFFSQVRGIKPEVFLNTNGRLESPLDSFPISVVDRMHPVSSVVRFAFVDEGMRTTTKFARFLRAGKPLFESLGNAEIIYVANSRYNFGAAQYVFQYCFRPHPLANQRTLAPDWRADSRILNRPQAQVAQQTRPQLMNLLFHYPYPKLRRNERHILETIRPGILVQSAQPTVNTQDENRQDSVPG